MGEYGGVRIETPGDLRDYLQQRGEQPFRIAYRDRGLSHTSLEEAARALDGVFDMLRTRRDIWLGFEEASKFMAPTSREPRVDWFLQYGRHSGINVMLVARRPVELSRLATAQSDVIVSFAQHEPRDIAWVRGVGGQEAADRIAALGQYDWDYILRGNAEVEAALDALCEGGENDGLVADPASNGDDGGGSGSGLVVPQESEGSAGGGNLDPGTGLSGEPATERADPNGGDSPNDPVPAKAGRQVGGSGSSRARGARTSRKLKRSK